MAAMVALQNRHRIRLAPNCSSSRTRCPRSSFSVWPCPFACWGPFGSSPPTSAGFRLLHSILGQKCTAPLLVDLLAAGILRLSCRDGWPPARASALGASVRSRDPRRARCSCVFAPVAFHAAVSQECTCSIPFAIHVVHVVLGSMVVAVPAGNFPNRPAVTVGVAYVSYRYFETDPFLALKPAFTALNILPQPTLPFPGGHSLQRH